MRNTQNAFHLAIPAKNLEDTQNFYVRQLGCKLARQYDDRITLDFFGDQVVCHLEPDIEVVEKPSYYPRHFGITFHDEVQFHNLVKLVKTRKIPFFVPVTERFKGKAEEHEFFALTDPTGNVLEFKYYIDPRMIY